MQGFDGLDDDALAEIGPWMRWSPVLCTTVILPPNGAPRRFACALGTAWLGATGLAFQLGAMTTGYALGGALISVAGLVSFTHYCIPSLIYQTLFARRTASQA
jgi:hypothetical protein